MSEEAKKNATVEFVEDDRKKRSTVEFVDDADSGKVIDSTNPNQKEPFPYLNFIPGMKEVNQSFIEGGNKLQETHPEILEFYKKQKLVKDVSGSIIAGGGASAILRQIPALAALKTAQPLISNQATVQATRAAKIANVQRAVQRHAIEGAVAVQVFDYKDVEDRIKATALAGVTAPVSVAVLNAGFRTGQGIFRAGRRVFNKLEEGGLRETSVGTLRDPRLPSIKKVRESLAQTENQANEVVNESVKSAKEATKKIAQVQKEANLLSGNVEERVKAVKTNVVTKVDAEKKLVKRSMKETERQINNSIDVLDEQLNVESNFAAKTVQNKTGQFFRSNSQAYSKHLDNVSDTMAKSGRVTLKEGADVLEKTIADVVAKDPDMATNPLVVRMKSLLEEKYGSVKTQNLFGGTRGAGHISLDDIPANMREQILRQSQTSRDQSTQIPFKELLTDMRDIWKEAYKGNRFSQEGIPAANLQSNFGDLVSSLPGGEDFKSLQSAYRPVISYMNKLSSVTKPFKGEAYIKEAEMLVRRIAKGGNDVAIADKDLLSFIEKGTENFASGIGSVSARARQIGDNIKVLKSQMVKMGLSSEKRIMDIAEEGVIRISKLERMGEKAGKLIRDEAERRSILIQREADLISARLGEQKAAIMKRISSLNNREALIVSLNSKGALIKRLAFGTAGIIGGLASSYAAVRGGKELISLVSEGR